jgi:hypothetical protein
LLPGKGRPAVAREPAHRLLRLANKLDFDHQDHYNPQQVAAMLSYRVFLSVTPVGTFPPAFLFWQEKVKKS